MKLTQTLVTLWYINGIELKGSAIQVLRFCYPSIKFYSLNMFCIDGFLFLLASSTAIDDSGGFSSVLVHDFTTFLTLLKVFNSICLSCNICIVCYQNINDLDDYKNELSDFY